MFLINAIDIFQKTVQPSIINKVLSRDQMKIGGLARFLELKINGSVMLTSNIDVPDKLSNGEIGKVFHIKVDNNRKVTKIYITFDDENTDNFASHNNYVPIERDETKIKIIITKPSSHEINRTQFPIMLAWASTVHKLQWNQFKEAVISFELFKQRTWNNG